MNGSAGYIADGDARSESELGHERRIDAVRAMSGVPPIASEFAHLRRRVVAWVIGLITAPLLQVQMLGIVGCFGPLLWVLA